MKKMTSEKKHKITTIGLWLDVYKRQAYAAVFITALQTYRKNFLAVLLLLTYGLHYLISFQQVLNAPLFFLILGLCEAAARGEKTKTNQMDTDEEMCIRDRLYVKPEENMVYYVMNKEITGSFYI